MRTTLRNLVFGTGMFVAALLAMPASGFAAGPYYVSKTGSDSGGNGSSGSPWASITNAVANAAAGESIYVAGGVYTQSVSFAGKSQVTVKGGYDQAGPWTFDPSNQTTVIFGNGNSPVVIPAGANSNVLQALTLKGGTSGTQGGIEFTGSAPYLFVEGCTLVSNVYGISAYSPGQIVTVRNTLVARNTSGGLFFETAWSTSYSCYLYNCTVANNGGDGFFGGGYNGHASGGGGRARSQEHAVHGQQGLWHQ